MFHYINKDRFKFHFTDNLFYYCITFVRSYPLERILIIEDETELREAIVDFLQIEGFKCIGAADGTEGVELARTELPDMIICDIKMPGLNGHEVLKELRRDSRTSSIPFIFLTALVDKSEVRQGMDLGADDYLTKPFLTEDLLSAIRTRLNKTQEIRERFQDLRQNITQKLPHELRTPLVSIIGYAQLLMDRYKDYQDPAIIEYSKSIYDAGIRLNKMIQNFLVYTKLKLASGDSHFRVEFQAEPTLITTPLISSIADSIAIKYRRKSDLSVQGNDGTVKISLNEFKLVIEELVDNAFKFSSVGDRVEINAAVSSNDYVISIKDFGRGMTDDQIASIDAYVQFERDEYEQQGMGLGLTISQNLVEMYGGRLMISSEYKKFTEVTVIFPVEKHSPGLTS